MSLKVGLARAVAMWLEFWRLLWQMGVRDIQSRYKGSVLGLLWSLITPLLTVALYTFLFSVVFKSQWGEDLRPPLAHMQQEQVQSTTVETSQSSVQASNFEKVPAGASQAPNAPSESYALILFAGLILHSFLAEIMTRSSGVMLSQANLVKKVVFPLHVLPAVVVFSAFFQLLVSSGLLLLWIELSALHWADLACAGASLACWAPYVARESWLVLPFLLLPLLLLGLAASWVLAALGVYLRDLGQIMNWLVMALMFSSPILYPLANLPQAFRSWLYLNPLTWVVEAWRHALFANAIPSLGVWVVCTLVALGVMALGAWVFARLQKGFADVL